MSGLPGVESPAPLILTTFDLPIITSIPSWTPPAYCDSTVTVCGPFSPCVASSAYDRAVTRPWPDISNVIVHGYVTVVPSLNVAVRLPSQAPTTSLTLLGLSPDGRSPPPPFSPPPAGAFWSRNSLQPAASLDPKSTRLNSS